ncbi:lipopolysaccharide biosynthesis protein [Butyrivibrio sp. XPD2006]|uniref:lipopolysaccharide biosynthesis protein n=1 Tax=Butyrivibrio sp. XPD2006 TaxID=1280668 RepID=UPI0003B4E5BC|nr:lipopolysaccharide biosynthesis protein [Butyrivibrio sp. XPD2006]
MKNSIINNVIWKFAERMLAQIVSLVVSIILARLLFPDDYGAVSMVTVFIAIANIFVTNGIPNALIQKKDADELDFSSCFYLNLSVSLLIYVAIFFAGPFIAGFYMNEILCPVIRVMGLRIIVASVNSIQHSYVSRHMMFKKYFWATLFGTVISGIIGIAMAYHGYGVWSLVAQYMTNSIIDTIVLFFTVDWRPKLLFSLGRVYQLFRFGWKILFEGVSNTVVGQLQNMIIGRVYTSADLAFYTKGQQFPNLLVNNITTSIGAVMFPAISNEQDDRKHVLEMLRKSIRMSSYVVYPMLTGLAAVAVPFIRVVLTDKWLDTAPYLQAFCFLNAPAVGMIPRHQALNGTGRSDVFMKEHILARIVAIVVLLITCRISIMAIILGSVVSTVILMAIIAYTSKKYNGYEYHDQIRDILPTLIGCVVMGVPVYFMAYLGLSCSTTLMLQVITGMAIYLLYSYLLHIKEFEICRHYVISIIKRK